MLDVSTQVFEAIAHKLSIRPYLSRNQIELKIAKNDARVTLIFEDFGAKIKGELLVKSLVLRPEKIHDLYRNLRTISDGAILEIFSSTPEALQVNPLISYDYSFYEFGPDPETIAIQMAKKEDISQMEAATMWYFEISNLDIEKYADILSEEVNETISALTKINDIVDEFRAYDVGSSSIIELWEGMKLEEDPQIKGRILENLISVWISSDVNFNIKSMNFRTESEEIDIIVENRARTEFLRQLQSPIMLVECKNWTSNVGPKEVRDFAQKVQNRPRFLCKIGVLITTSTYTEQAENELLGYRGKDFLITTIDGAHLADAISKRMNFSDMCRDIVYAAGLK